MTPVGPVRTLDSAKAQVYAEDYGTVALDLNKIGHAIRSLEPDEAAELGQWLVVAAFEARLHRVRQEDQEALQETVLQAVKNHHYKPRILHGAPGAVE